MGAPYLYVFANPIVGAGLERTLVCPRFNRISMADKTSKLGGDLS